MIDRNESLFLEKGLLTPMDVHFACFMEKLSGGEGLSLFLAAALASRSTREGHVCLDLAGVAGKDLLEGEDPGEGLVCPDLGGWCRDLRMSDVVGRPGDFRPLILDQRARLYLLRYWSHQETLARLILDRVCEEELHADPGSLREGLDRLFPVNGEKEIDWQRVAALASLIKRFSVISGGPGTGKTTTVAKILALLLEQAGEKRLRIALSSPTGKGAARLEEAVRDATAFLDCPDAVKRALPEEASTLHRLLGSTPGSSRFRHDARNPLDVDVVVVDEASMVDLALMSRLVEALPSGARLILLGDKDQLASVEAGAVLGDICNTGRPHAFSRPFARLLSEGTGFRVPAPSGGGDEGGMGDCIVELEKSYRFSEDSGIYGVSRAVNRGDGDLAVTLLRKGTHKDISWVEPGGDLGWPEAFRETILRGYRGCFETRDPGEVLRLLDDFRILCALRQGPCGVTRANSAVERLLMDAGVLGSEGRPWYAGRPILITRNDYRLRLFNGDLGVVLPDPEADGELRAFFPGPGGMLRRVHPVRLPEHETVYAMTVHKSQGSEFREVLFLLPEKDTPVLTRELLYTAVTRARDRVALWGHEDLLRSAVGRRIERRSGLRDALWGERGRA